MMYIFMFAVKIDGKHKYIIYVSKKLAQNVMTLFVSLRLSKKTIDFVLTYWSLKRPGGKK